MNQQFNIHHSGEPAQAYLNGLLPQRNQKGLYYRESSCRSNLLNFSLSSENRRIIRKTEDFSHKLFLLSKFDFNIEVQKQCHDWIRANGWDFPSSSVKTVFTNHIFNNVYVWSHNHQTVAYALCYFDSAIAHIAYVFYHPDYSHGNLPIRLVLQAVMDSQQLGLTYCYLGRFSSESGFYKRNMPGFEYFQDGRWIGYNKSSPTG